MARISKKLRAILDEFEAKKALGVCVYGMGCKGKIHPDSEQGFCGEHSVHWAEVQEHSQFGK